MNSPLTNPAADARLSQVIDLYGGAGRVRTGVDGFAIPGTHVAHRAHTPCVGCFARLMRAVSGKKSPSASSVPHALGSKHDQEQNMRRDNGLARCQGTLDDSNQERQINNLPHRSAHDAERAASLKGR